MKLPLRRQRTKEELVRDAFRLARGIDAMFPPQPLPPGTGPLALAMALMAERLERDRERIELARGTAAA